MKSEISYSISAEKAPGDQELYSDDHASFQIGYTATESSTILPNF